MARIASRRAAERHVGLDSAREKGTGEESVGDADALAAAPSRDSSACDCFARDNSHREPGNNARKGAVRSRATTPTA